MATQQQLKAAPFTLPLASSLTLCGAVSLLSLMEEESYLKRQNF